MADLKYTEVDTDIINTTINSINNSVKELKSIVTVMENDVVNNLTSAWEGEAKEAFKQSIDIFNSLLKEIVNEHTELSEQMNYVNDQYSKVVVAVDNIITNNLQR